MERDKKNYEKMDFCSYPPAHLIDFFSHPPAALCNLLFVIPCLTRNPDAFILHNANQRYKITQATLLSSQSYLRNASSKFT